MGNMTDTRKKNGDWSIKPDASGSYSYDQAQLAVLMDIRDELHRLNALLHCHSFVGIPNTLKRISRNTAKPRKKNKHG
jgi:hypothetical protein